MVVEQRLHERGGSRVALALLLVLAGCRIGTSLPEEESRELTMTEAAEITTAIVQATLESTVFSPQQVLFTHSHGPAGVHSHPIEGPYTHTVVINGPLPSGHNLFNANLLRDVSCGAGGQMRVEAEAVGEGNPLVQRGFIDFAVGIEPLQCFLTIETAAGGRIQLTSPPYVTGDARSENDGRGTAELSGTLTGGFGWQAEAKAGQCELELDFAASGESLEAITTVPVSGTLCGLTIDMAVPIT